MTTLPIETSWTQKRRVEHIRSIGRRQYDNVQPRIETVEFAEQLVKSLFSLITSTSDSSTSAAPDRIQFVNEYDGGCRFLGLTEKVADAAGADTDEHFDEFGRIDAEERNTSFTGHSSREEGLTGSWWPD